MGEFKPGIDQAGKTLDVKYSIEKLYGEAFPSLARQALFKIEGVRDAALGNIEQKLGNGFKPNLNGHQAAELDWSGIGVLESEAVEEYNYLGTPIFMPVRLKGGSYNMIENGKAVTVALPDMLLPATTTVDARRSKILAKTDISGNVGSVKEQFGFSDWDITIRGLIIHQNPNLYPKDALLQLLRYEAVADAIEVSCPLFNYWKVKRVVIEDFRQGRIDGKPFAIPFQLQCCSDEPQELIINNNQLGK